MNIDNSLEEILNFQFIKILDLFILDLKEILKNEGSLSKEKREEILKDLLNIIELKSPNLSILNPKIKDKINQIKHLLESSNNIDELKEDHLISPENANQPNI
jgi:pyruvate-formate lyase-activating enzyme